MTMKRYLLLAILCFLNFATAPIEAREFSIVTYNVENAFASWQPSLDYAVTHTNRGVRAEGYSYRVI